MKKIAIHSLLKVLAIFTLFLTGTAHSFAQNGGESVTKSDDTLFIILIAFIIVLLVAIMVLAGAIKSIAGNRDLWKNRFEKTAVIALLITLLSSHTASASNESIQPLMIMSSEVFYLLVSTIVLLFLIVVFLGRTLSSLLKELSGKKEEEEVSIITRLADNLTESVPVEREAEVMTDHEYDGIRELDNVLPPWWVYLFYATIIFAVVYMVRFHIVGSGNVMAEEYQAEIELAEAQKKAMMESNPESALAITAENVEVLTDQTDLNRGKSIFIANCASCHKETGAGDIGPNLTDNYWIHGGGISNVFKVIKNGVQGKMISWESQIKPDDMQRVASYVLSLQGSNPPNAKEPQGDLYVPKSDNDTSESTAEEQTEMPEDTSLTN